MGEQNDTYKEELKTVGGAIPFDLYWKFKRIQADRKETATQALENAIRLYIELETPEVADNG